MNGINYALDRAVQSIVGSSQVEFVLRALCDQLAWCIVRHEQLFDVKSARFHLSMLLDAAEQVAQAVSADDSRVRLAYVASARRFVMQAYSAACPDLSTVPSQVYAGRADEVRVALRLSAERLDQVHELNDHLEIVLAALDAVLLADAGSRFDQDTDDVPVMREIAEEEEDFE